MIKEMRLNALKAVRWPSFDEEVTVLVTTGITTPSVPFSPSCERTIRTEFKAISLLLLRSILNTVLPKALFLSIQLSLEEFFSDEAGIVPVGTVASSTSIRLSLEVTVLGEAEIVPMGTRTPRILNPVFLPELLL